MSTSKTLFVSLGVNCEVRTILKLWEDSHAGSERTGNSMAIAGNNFFDWNITNVWSIIKCLNSDFDRVFLKENLISRAETDGKLNYVDDVESGIRFHHTFSRVDHITEQSTIEAEYEEKRSKIDYLIRRFRSVLLTSDPVCFVRRAEDNLGETISLLMALKQRREERPWVLVAVRGTLLEGEIPSPYDTSYRQVVVPPGEWTLDHWQPALMIMQNLLSPWWNSVVEIDSV